MVADNGIHKKLEWQGHDFGQVGPRLLTSGAGHVIHEQEEVIGGVVVRHSGSPSHIGMPLGSADYQRSRFHQIQPARGNAGQGSIIEAQEGFPAFFTIGILFQGPGENGSNRLQCSKIVHQIKQQVQNMGPQIAKGACARSSRVGHPEPIRMEDVVENRRCAEIQSDSADFAKPGFVHQLLEKAMRREVSLEIACLENQGYST